MTLVITYTIGQIIFGFITIALLIIAMFAARKLAGGDDSGTGILMFPATAIAAIVSGLFWLVFYFNGWF